MKAPLHKQTHGIGILPMRFVHRQDADATFHIRNWLAATAILTFGGIAHGRTPKKSQPPREPSAAPQQAFQQEQNSLKPKNSNHGSH